MDDRPWTDANRLRTELGLQAASRDQSSSSRQTERAVQALQIGARLVHGAERQRMVGPTEQAVDLDAGGIAGEDADVAHRAAADATGSRDRSALFDPPRRGSAPSGLSRALGAVVSYRRQATRRVRRATMTRSYHAGPRRADASPSAAAAIDSRRRGDARRWCAGGTVFGRRKREEEAAAEAAREAERHALFAKLAERPEHICPFLGPRGRSHRVRRGRQRGPSLLRVR